MNAVQRRMEIFQILQQNKTAEVNALAARFNVSKMTIRRDLSIFEKQGLVTTNYGGAYLNSGTAIDPSFSLKTGQQMDAKQCIARVAASWVQEGQTVGLDCGTTAIQVLKHLQGKQVTVVTNSWHAASYAQNNSKMRLLLAPGEYAEQTGGVISNITAEFFRAHCYDWAFVATQGFNCDFGASVADADEAVVKAALMHGATKKVLLADHSKIGKCFLARHALPDEFDCLLTDEDIDGASLESLRGCCREVVVAQRSGEDMA